MIHLFLQNDPSHKPEIDEKTREEILSLIAHHVTAVNYIYRNTKFDGRFEHRNIRFEVSYLILLFYGLCHCHQNTNLSCHFALDIISGSTNQN